MIYSWICMMAATLAINTILVLSLLTTLTWEQRGMFVFATIVLVGGLLFTIRTMQRLTKLN